MNKATYAAACAVIEKQRENVERMKKARKSSAAITEQHAYISGLMQMLEIIATDNYTHAMEEPQ